MTNTKISIDILRAKKESLLKDISDLQEELLTVKLAERKSKNFEFLNKLDNIEVSGSGIKNNVSEVNVIRNLPKFEMRKLALYKHFSGVNIIKITAAPVTIKKNESLYEYNVLAAIQTLKFKIRYVTNKYFKLSGADISTDYPTIKTLHIEMVKEIHNIECRNCLEYYSANPSYMGQAILCLKEYYELNKKRREMTKTFFEEYSDYLSVSLISDNGYFQIDFRGKITNILFFQMVWGISFNRNANRMRNTFSVEIIEEDEELMEKLPPLFKSFYKCPDDQEEEGRLVIFKDIISVLADVDEKYSDKNNI